MSTIILRILLLADTHLGFDWPTRPRVKRRRRGPDFFDTFKQALRPAVRGDVDLVVHGGDLFHSRGTSPVVVERALMSLANIARSGVPVLIVPGNHEGSRIPLHLAAAMPNLHIFHRPETKVLELNGARVAFSGFPFARRIAEKFDELLAESGYESIDADCRLLCLHQSVEGATVGVQNFTFHAGSEVVSGSSIPAAFDAVLAGHIHRSQYLTHDLAGNELPAPVIYPGSTERTSFAERDEEKHYALVNVSRKREEPEFKVEVAFESLPARPMAVVSIDARDLFPNELEEILRSELVRLDPDAVVQVRFGEAISEELISGASAAVLRSMAPETMNISTSWASQPSKGSSR